MNPNYVLSAHRTWLHADYMRYHFYQDPEPLPIKSPSFFVKPKGAFLLIWYGLLYNVCDALYNNHELPEHLIKDFESIQPEFQLCRHFALHVKPGYTDIEQFGIFFLNGAHQKVERLHRELGKYLTELIAPNIPENVRNAILSNDDLSTEEILKKFGYDI